MRKRSKKKTLSGVTRSASSRNRQDKFKRSGEKPGQAYEAPFVGPDLPLEEVRLREVIPHLISSDETLLERARVQWQFGDWDSLAALDRTTLQSHPERAKLALLAAAGYLQKGNTEAAVELIRLANNWGCSRNAISQILIAGLHNTLGRASALAGRESQAHGHFENAISIGSPGSEVRLLAEVRISHQLLQLGLSRNGAIQRQFKCNQVLSADENKNVIDALENQNKELIDRLTKQAEDLSKLQKKLEKAVKEEISNSTKQLEAFIEIKSYLGAGEPIGDMHGWPISPDFALYLVELIETRDYDIVIEFGSGTSTALIARALGKIGRYRPGARVVKQVAFEHLSEYYQKTWMQLRRFGLDKAVQLIYSPLVPYVSSSGISYPYYDCQSILANLSTTINTPEIRALILVDGPPGSTGKHARYPAFPIVLSNFKANKFDFLLDDYARRDEKEITELWISEAGYLGLRPQLTEIKTEKGACMIELTRHA